MSVIYEQVTRDLYERMEHGMKEYGVPLHPFNGRYVLQDAYEEIMDLAFYLRQYIFEASGDHRQPLPEIGHLVVEDVRNGWVAPNPADTISVMYENVLKMMFQMRAEMSL